MDTISDSFLVAKKAGFCVKAAKINQISLNHRLFKQESFTFIYSKKAFLVTFLAILIVFGGSAKQTQAASWRDSLASFLSAVGLPRNDEGQTQNNQQDDANLPIVQNSSLVAYAGPNLEVSTGQQEIFTIYTVQKGDTLNKIAADYGISLNTILWANNLNSSGALRIGDDLKILPVDGILYTVKKGDNLSAIAKKYKSEIEQIIEFNDLSVDGSVKEGDILLLPEGEMPYQTIVKSAPKPSLKQAFTPTAKQSLKEIWQEINDFFIVPVSGIITQLKHGQNGVDVGNSCGTPVFAAADGMVTVVQPSDSRSVRANGGYGNTIRISHSNGALTLYAHLFNGSILVRPGQEVKQGQQIAQLGGGWEWVGKKRVRMEGSGRSTGCHLHFETRGGVKNVLSQYRRGSLVRTSAAQLAIDASAAGSGDVIGSDSEDKNSATE